jgi:hypothetical protein
MRPNSWMKLTGRLLNVKVLAATRIVDPSLVVAAGPATYPLCVMPLGSSSTIGQTAMPIGGEPFFQRRELREQRALNACAGLVAGPKLVTKRFEYVIGADAHVGSAGFDHLQYCIEHARDRAEGRILALFQRRMP